MAKTQRGEAAECALVVASVLLGAGYRTFVVQGTARPSLVAGDTSILPCPYLAPPYQVSHHRGAPCNISLSCISRIEHF